MTFLPAWAVDGSKVPASMARRVAWATSSGATGVVNAADLQVTSLPVPGGAVRIMPGTAVVANGYPSGDGQSYVVANDAAFDLAVPATGSGGGATRYVVARVDDPEFGGQVPVEPLTAPYCSPELVSSVTGLNYPFVLLATITQPASTATITQAMIADSRKLANPRRQREVISTQLTVVERLTSTDTGDGEEWPNEAGAWVDIPAWATQVKIMGHWAGCAVPTSSTDLGLVWVQVGLNADPDKFNTWGTGYDNTTVASASRVGLMVADTRTVPVAARGKRMYVHLRAYSRATSIPLAQRIFVDQYSSAAIDLEFVEVPS